MNSEAIARDLDGSGIIKTEVSMKEYTTFKTGGPADVMIWPEGIEDAARVVTYAVKQAIPLTVLGGGSNLVVGDRGIRGIVLRMAQDKLKTGNISYNPDGRIWSDSISYKRDLIEFAMAHAYGDCEFMVGIPGCVGGGIIMNAGTFMGNYIDILDTIRYVDTAGAIKEIACTREMAHYRGIDIDDVCVVWGGFFKFTKKGDETAIRHSAQLIVDDRKLKHPQDPSAGSVFKNPEGHFSWKLVNDAGLKGKQIGGAMVSNLHTNFIINAGGATSADIRSLIAHVQSVVKNTFGVELHPEVKVIGEF